MQSLEKRLTKNEDFKTKYHKTVKQYIDNNRATKTTPEDLTPEKTSTTLIINYIPHHVALNQYKPDKVRVVYDAAANYRNCSLNDHLLKGPDLLKNLVSIVIRFRLGQFTVTSDIRKCCTKCAWEKRIELHCKFCGGKILTTTSMTIKWMCIYLVKTTHLEL